MNGKIIHLVRRLAVILFWPALAVIAWGELSPSIHIADGWDKLAHFSGYLGLAALATTALGRGTRSTAAMVALILTGTCLEVLQGWTGRDPDVWDALTNVLGVMAGWFIAMRIVVRLSSQELLLAEAPAAMAEVPQLFAPASSEHQIPSGHRQSDLPTSAVSLMNTREGLENDDSHHGSANEE